MRYNVIPLASLGKNALTHYWLASCMCCAMYNGVKISSLVVLYRSRRYRDGGPVHCDGAASITIIGQLIAQCQ